MPEKKIKSQKVHPPPKKGVWLLAVMFAATLLLPVALSALALKLFAPAPTVAPEAIEQAAISTMQIAVPIYVDGTVNAILPGAVAGTLAASIPNATPIPPTPTQPSQPCDLAGFVSDATIPDGTQLSASEAFTKVWLIRNLGSCTWTEDYALTFSSGEIMGGKSPITLGRELAPGDIMEISANLVAPSTSGVYSGHWMLQNSTGDSFGLSPTNQPLSFHISVGSQGSIALDMVEQACFATWSSAIGMVECPNPDDMIGGGVSPVTNTLAEFGIEFILPAIEVIPNEGADGFINGEYPLLQIQNGDTFHAIVGCADNQRDCNLVFELQIDTGGRVPDVLGRWFEKSDGVFQKMVIDLSPLAGESIRLVLSSSSLNGSSVDNKGLWITPIVFRAVK
ncbi:MAG: hypothetical protein JXR32_06320 [Anaerolineaceae bacterium]|nr:hypothetical protein [Anaerolineaceae bacterium]